MIGPVVRRISSSVFVGRIPERARLEAGLDAAVGGEAGLALVGGEAGIGKTRLAAELATMAAARGMAVARGHCLEATTASLPFAPFIEILRPLLAADQSADGAGSTDAERLWLTRLVLDPGAQPSTERPSSTGDARLALFQAVFETFAHAAADHGLLVVVEDLHWADASSLDLLRFVAAQLDRERLLVLATFRTDELHRRHPLLPFVGELVRLPAVLRLDLPPFTGPEVADQLAGITGSRPSEEAVRRTLARSDGNPFFVEEISGQPTGGGLPATLHDVLLARMGTLSTDARMVVTAAAVVGRDVAQELLGRIVAQPERRLLDGLRTAVDRHILVPIGLADEPGFAFRHALIQELAYAELLPSERIGLHRAVVTSLQAAGGSSGEIARHAFLGHDLRTGLAHSVKAADQAIEALAFAEALDHLERALEAWSQVVEPESVAGRDEGALLMLASRCAGALGRWSRAAALGRAALTHFDPVERRKDRIGALLDQSRWEMLNDDEIARARAVREAAELAPIDPPNALRSRVLSELAHLANHNGRADEARRLAGDALEMARSIGERAEEARALGRLGEALENLLQPQTAEPLLEEAGRIAAEGHAPFDDFFGYLAFRQAGMAFEAGAFARAIEIADAGAARAARSGRLGQRSGFLLVIKIRALAALGRWGEAEMFVDRAERETAVVTARMALQVFVDVLVRQGRMIEAAAALRATDVAYAIPEDAYLVLETRMSVANAEGRWDEARAAADEAIGLYEDPGRNLTALSLLLLAVRGEADRAEHARNRRRTAEATESRRVGLARLDLLRRGIGAATAAGGAGPLIEADLATAEAEGSRLEGRPDAARWDEVARLREALAQPWERAYARFHQAEAILATRGDKRAALDRLQEAHRIASELGARPLVGTIEMLARRGRVRLVSARRPGRTRRATTPEGVVVALTPREWDVLSLVAAGHTNREIGETLFISEKTASVHISNVMDKLGALSRYEAAAAATRLGLLEPS